jgi:hypothetical protein
LDNRLRLNCKFGANKFHSKPPADMRPLVDYFAGGAYRSYSWSLHVLNRDHPILTDCDHPTVKLI